MGYKVWAALVGLRILLCLWPMTGYIHPDEFFQNSEPLAGDILKIDVFRPWEFNSTQPLRSVFFPYITTGLGLKILQYADASGILQLTPYTLLIIPRLMMIFVSLMCIDYPIYMICKLLGLNAAVVLTVYASSFVTLAYYTKTFSNSYETMVFALLLLLVVDSRLDQFVQRLKPAKEQGLKGKKKAAVGKVKTRPNHSFWIGVFITEGTFNRITFPCYCLIPMVFWVTGSSSQLGAHAVGEIVRNTLALLPGILTMLVSNLAIDSVYYGTLDPKVLINPQLLLASLNSDLLRDNITVTPLNSLRYNLDVNNIAQHGLHPRLTHMLVNLPMLFLPLVICFVSEIWSFVRGARQTVSTGFAGSSSQAFFALCFATPIFLLSIVPHQEPRFIIPVLVPLVLLYAEFVMSSPSLPNIPWIVWNILGCLMFGFIHQGGVIPSVMHAHNLNTQPTATPNSPTHYHLVYYHTYMPPRHLALYNQSLSAITAGEESKTTPNDLPNLMTFHDLMGADSLILSSTVSRLLDRRQTPVPKSYQKEVYVFAPASLDATFCRLGVKHNYKLVEMFFPHVSTEDLPEFMPSYNCVAEQERSYRHMSTLQSLRALFSLNMYKAEAVRITTPTEGPNSRL